MPERSVSAGQGVSHRIGILEWMPEDGISAMIRHELVELGHHPVLFAYEAPIPEEVDAILSHGPHGKLLPLFARVAHMPAETRPTVVHWNTEGFPDLRIPLPMMGALCDMRSWLGRSDLTWLRTMVNRRPVSVIDSLAIRFRYIGDYRHAHRKGMIDLLADSSEVYVKLYGRQGVPAVHLPWGSSSIWYADLACERDIDVLWMGKRGSTRRSILLDRVRENLRRRGVQMYVADGVENPFVFDEERTTLLNRAKVTLNLARTWYDDNYSRFALAAPNRSLIVSEPLLPHCSAYSPDVHYVAAPVDRLGEAIDYYLRHEEDRRRIADNAYRLVTEQLTFRNGLARLVDLVSRRRSALGHGQAASANPRAGDRNLVISSPR